MAGDYECLWWLWWTGVKQPGSRLDWSNPPTGSPTAGTAHTGEAQRRSRVPEFKSVDEEIEFWSKHSILEFMDEGEEVELDFSDAMSEREERRWLERWHKRLAENMQGLCDHIEEWVAKEKAMAEDYLCTAECMARFYDEDTQKDYCELQPCKCTSCQEGWYPQFGVIRCDGAACPIDEKRRRVLKQQLGDRRAGTEQWEVDKTQAYEVTLRCSNCGRSFALWWKKGTPVKVDEMKCPRCECVGCCFVEWLTRWD